MKLTIIATGIGFVSPGGINADGQAVGQVDGLPFVWNPAVPNGIVGALTMLPLLPLPSGGPNQAMAADINDAGDIVGSADAIDASGLSVSRAVVWRGGAPQDLGTLVPNIALPGTFFGGSEALAINNHGVIVGGSDSVVGVSRAFMRDPFLGRMIDLGNLPSGAAAGLLGPSQARGINDGHDIVGLAEGVDPPGNQTTRAFLLPLGSPVMLDLGTHLPGPAPGTFLNDSMANAINDAGMIVGSAAGGLAGAPAAAPAIFRANDSPILPFPAEGVANGVNASGRIVGEVIPSQGFAFDNVTGTTDLTAVLGPGAPQIVRAVAINAAGQILAEALSGTNPQVVLLTP
jgi:probable HAF family extracellular repeat protein